MRTSLNRKDHVILVACRLYGVKHNPCSRCNLHTELQAGIMSLMHMFMIWEHVYETKHFYIQVFL